MSASVEQDTQPCISNEEVIAEQQHAGRGDEDDNDLNAGQKRKITYEILDVNDQWDVCEVKPVR